MTFARTLLLLLLAGGGWEAWQRYEAQRLDALVERGSTPEGFVAVTMPSAARRNSIYIMTPPNCPSAEAERARQLAAGLEARNIPHKSGSSYRASAPVSDSRGGDGIDRALAVLDQGPPTVFINGFAKSDPELEAVIAIYNRTK